MKYYFDQLATLIRDHTFITAAISIVIALLGSAYAVGFQLGQNRQVYLEDKISDFQEKIIEYKKYATDARSTIEEQNSNVKLLKAELSAKIEQLATARADEKRLATLASHNDAMAADLAVERRKLAESRKEIEGIRQEKDKFVLKLNQISAEKSKIGDMLNKYEKEKKELAIYSERLKKEFDELTVKKTKIEETIFQAAAGDIVARITHDDPWINYFKIEDVSRVSTEDFPFVAMLGSTYKIEGDVIYDVTNGDRTVVFAGEPKAAAIGGKVCFGYLTKLVDKRLKANVVCRKNEVTSRGIYD